MTYCYLLRLYLVDLYISVTYYVKSFLVRSVDLFADHLKKGEIYDKKDPDRHEL